MTALAGLDAFGEIGRGVAVHGGAHFLPAGPDAGREVAREGDAGTLVERGVGEALDEGARDADLVLEGELDVDALDLVGVFAETLERNDDVLVELEGVGVLGDGCRAGALLPVGLAIGGRAGDEARAAAGARHFTAAFGHGVEVGFVVGDDVGEKHHLGHAAALELGTVADGAHVAPVDVLETRKLDRRMAAHEVAHLDDGGCGFGHGAVELEADRAAEVGHPVQHEGGAHDDAVRAFLLYGGQAVEKLVGDVLAEARLAEGAARNREALCPDDRALVGELVDVELGGLDLVDAAEVVVDALDADHAAVDVDHLPPGEVVDRRAPEGGFLAARVDGDVAADAAGVGRGGVDREDEACGGRGLLDAAGDAARAAFNHGMLALDARQAAHDGTAVAVELLHVDHGRVGVQRNGAARVARAARARNDGELELEERAHEGRDLLLAVGREDDERILDAPVGGVGDVRDARKAVEADVVRIGDRGQTALHFGTALDELREAVVEAAHGGARLGDEAKHVGIALGALANGLEAAAHLAHEQFAALRVHDQVVDQIGIALDRPDVAEHFEEHAGGTAGAARAAKRLNRVPGLFAQETDHNLAVRERRVVIGNLANARGSGHLGHQGGTPLVRRVRRQARTALNGRGFFHSNPLIFKGYTSD